MVRKTVTINEGLFYNLQSNNIIDRYQSFSEMVSHALQVLIEQDKKERYKKAMLEASKDKLYLQDIKNIEDDFKYSDYE